MDSLLFGIGLGNNAFVFSNQLTETFNLGATTGIKQLPEAMQQAIGFDTLNNRAINAIKQNTGKVIQELTGSSKQAVSNLIQRLLSENIPPAKMGREIRQLIGLTDSQMKAVTNFRLQLETRSILGLTPPEDRRLNAIEAAQVRRHMNQGTMQQDKIDEMVEKYYQRLLNKRALDIARTESMHSINQGQQEAWMQGLDQGVLDINKDRKFWLTAGDEKVRTTHRAIPAMNPGGVPITSPFATPFGFVMSPGDYNVGLINCRCSAILIST